MQMEMKKLNEYFPDWLTDGGIFDYLEGFDVPWKDEPITSNALNVAYHGQHSSEKYAASILRNPSLTLTHIVTALYVKYGKNWQYLWNALNAEYDPIENYNGKEHYIKENTGTQKNDQTKGAEIEQLGSEADATSITSEHKVSADDSSTYQPESQDTQTGSSTHTFNNRKTKSNAGELTRTDALKEEYTLDRHGNLGVTTSQQMIESEAVLRDKYTFFELVFSDIDKFLTISVY